jgi:two-component SAPR family response regulator
VNSPNYQADVFGETIVPNIPLSQLKVLVVEDEGLIALNLELILRRFGCKVIGPVSDVDDILDTVKKYHPDGILLDVNLRGRKVFEVLPELIALGIPCVLSSGYDDPMLFPAAFRNLPRIPKPFDESALQRACLEFCSLAEARRSRQSKKKRGTSRQPLLVDAASSCPPV